MATRAGTERWLERTRALPADPGVYLMKDSRGRVVYVGKAKNLRSRVRSYFLAGSSDYRAFTFILGEVLDDIETLVTTSEKEALILERELIREHEPRFNVIWRDDKQFLCLRVDRTHEYPRVEVVRNMGRDGARYFGPYHSASAARKTLRVVNRYFQLRTCRDSTLYNRQRPCLEYQIGRCPAPCVFEVDREDYGHNVDDVLMFLDGRTDALVDRLESRMWAAAEEEAFEVAARIRDQVRAIKKTLEPQHIALPSMRDQDVIGFFADHGQASMAVLMVRNGRIRNVMTHIFDAVGFSEGALLESFLLQFYAERTDTPREVLVPFDLEGAAALSELLTERRTSKVAVRRPQRGERRSVLELARSNAEHALEEARRKAGGLTASLDRLKSRLMLSRAPRTMECFDISNLQGGQIVGSKVRFSDGQPDKSGYRRYRIKSTAGQDDFASMYEIIYRRVVRGQKSEDLPDLMVIDGGKGQLNAALAAVRDVGVDGLDIISLAKSRVQKERGKTGESQRSPERVFVPNVKDPIVLSQNAPELLLLARIRDEAHRFAITFQRELRRKKTLRSSLEDIPGIGAKRRAALLKHLGSLKAVQEASVETLSTVPGLGPSAAKRIYEWFRGAGDPEEIGRTQPSKSDASGKHT